MNVQKKRGEYSPLFIGQDLETLVHPQINHATTNVVHECFDSSQIKNWIREFIEDVSPTHFDRRRPVTDEIIKGVGVGQISVDNAVKLQGTVEEQLSSLQGSGVEAHVK